MGQITLQFDSPPADRTGDPRIAFEIGWDFAHHALTPPADHLSQGTPLRQGWDAGRASFGSRTLAPTRHTRKWLQLRLNAWRRGRVFENMQVTPNHLRQIEVLRCPITRDALTQATCTPSDASIDRVRNDAGYAAGNLVVMSARANLAKGDADFDDALARMRQGETAATSAHPGAACDPGAEPADLSAAEWARVAVLCSFVTELPHAQAAGLPLLVMPPNRLRLFNPVQALQALVTRQFAKPGWSARAARVGELLPGKSLRRDFHVFVNALVPRVLEAGQPADADAMRWALEDAWRNPLVLRCWRRVALQLDPAQCERVVLRASALRLDERSTVSTTFEQATDGWGLAQRGYASLGEATALVPSRPVRPSPLPRPAQPRATDEKRVLRGALTPAPSFAFGARGEALAAFTAGH